MNFTTLRKGYDKKEVDLYIKDLETKVNELTLKSNALEIELKKFRTKEKEISKKNDSISTALTAAVEKAKQIEKSSENVYKLKIQQVSILYSKWEKLFNELVEKYPQLEDVENVRALQCEFKNNIKTTLKEDYQMYSVNSPVKTDNDTMRMLLNKLNSRGKEQVSKKTIKVERKQPSKDMLNSQTELNRIEDKAPLIKPICDNLVSNSGGEESLVDKFLKEENVERNAYSNIITSKVKAIPTDVNETGFDLKEAINPKEDLSEIMKAFDFFNEEE